jgi:beta-N-acetylhexosaminidase
MAEHVAPFAAAVAGNVGAIMTAHVRYPQVDSSAAATFSTTWLEGVLRKRLGFAGLVLTDDLEMGAVTGSGSVGEAALRAARAGADGLLICRNLDAIKDSIAQLRAAADEDVDLLASLVTSLARLQEAASLHPPREVPAAALPALLGPDEHHALASRFTPAAATAGLDPTAY